MRPINDSCSAAVINSEKKEMKDSIEPRDEKEGDRSTDKISWLV